MGLAYHIAIRSDGVRISFYLKITSEDIYERAEVSATFVGFIRKENPSVVLQDSA